MTQDEINSQIKYYDVKETETLVGYNNNGNYIWTFERDNTITLRGKIQSIQQRLQESLYRLHKLTLIKSDDLDKLEFLREQISEYWSELDKYKAQYEQNVRELQQEHNQKLLDMKRDQQSEVT